jgi:molybdopterin synthase catalytic subunit
MDSIIDNTRYLIKVSEDIPSLEECASFVSDPSCGAISTFTGITRNNFQGKQVLKLSYEGYVPMAERELRKICNEAIQKYPSIVKIAAVHILGDCPVQAASVILCASSPHRKEAMRCIEFLIDELKARVPIWKREVYQEGDGESVWKENIEWFQGKQQRVMIKADHVNNHDGTKTSS